jgi:hypothetical protein
MQTRNVTNPKIAGLEPRWAPYRGFSLLFDNPGDSYAPAGEGLLRLDCKHDAPLALYAGLEAFLQRVDLARLREQHLFCPLPFHSYHVTVWDGINAGNAVHLSDQDRSQLDDLFADLPRLLGTPNRYTEAAQTSPLVDWHEQIEFVCRGLTIWSNSALVALLAPKDHPVKRKLDKVVRHRGFLNEPYRQAFNLRMQDGYSPHITLGYFANQELAESAAPLMGAWEDRLLETVAGLSITFSAISLYGFSDMATFLKKG